MSAHAVRYGASASDPLSPSARDVHLTALRDEVLPLIKKQRLTTAEVLYAGQTDRPKVFSTIDMDLLWRVLTHAERQRYVTHEAAPDEPPRRWRWDLTPEGQTQVSLYAILMKRAKYGGILALAAVVAAIVGDAKTVTAVFVSVLIVFAFFMWSMWAMFRWLAPFTVDAIRECERDLQRRRELAGMDPWWPPVDPSS